MVVRTIVLIALATGSLIADADGGGRVRRPPPIQALLLDALVSGEFSSGEPGGVVLVAQGGVTVLRRAYGKADIELDVPMRADSVLRIGSLTKQFTAVAILQLVEEGAITLSDDVRRYVQEFHSYGRTITIEQLLSHTSGLPTLVDRSDFEVLARLDHTVDALLGLTRDAPLHFEPGTAYRYSDTGYILLGAVLERVRRRSYADVIEGMVRPLGLQQTTYGDDARILPHRAKGYSVKNAQIVPAAYISMTVPHAAGALVSTVDDLLRWHQALSAGRVIRKDLLERAWTERTLSDGTASGYGFGWNVCRLAGRRTIQHGGWINGFTATSLHVPEENNLTVIALVNRDEGAPDAAFVARRAARFVMTGSWAAPSVTLSPRERAALIGTYQIGDQDFRVIAEEAGTLYVRRNQRPRQSLVPVSSTDLALADSDGTAVLRFELGHDGRAARVRFLVNCAPGDMAVRVDQ